MSAHFVCIRPPSLYLDPMPRRHVLRPEVFFALFIVASQPSLNPDPLSPGRPQPLPPCFTHVVLQVRSDLRGWWLVGVPGKGRRQSIRRHVKETSFNDKREMVPREFAPANRLHSSKSTTPHPVQPLRNNAPLRKRQLLVGPVLFVFGQSIPFRSVGLRGWHKEIVG